MKKIYKVINKIIRKKINLNSLKDLKKLTLNDIEKINNDIRGRYQSKVFNIFKKDIMKIINQQYCEKKLNLRIGVQAKYIWKKKASNSKRVLSFDKSGVWRESLNLPNSCFPTRPHQDLSNNGFRSSSIIIFFIQLSKKTKKSSMLEVAKFNSKQFLEKTYNYSGYENEIAKSVNNKKKWIIPSALKPGKILLMDSMTCHRSGKFAELPRIALNVKFQPTNLFYIYKSLGLKNNLKKIKGKKERLLRLANDLESLVKYNHGLHFELSITHHLLNYKLSKKFMKKLFYKQPSNNMCKKYIAGGILRKTLKEISAKDIKNIYKNNYQIANLSCAQSIYNTIQ